MQEIEYGDEDESGKTPDEELKDSLGLWLLGVVIVLIVAILTGVAG